MIQLSDAMELAKVVHWEVDTTTMDFVFNDAFYSFYGTTAEREGGYHMSREEYAKRFVHPDDMPLFRQVAEKRQASDRPDFLCDVEHRIVRRDGQVRHIIARIRVTRDGAGRVVRYHGANQDITECKQAEEAFRESEARFRAAFETSAIGMALVALDGRYLRVNRSLCTALGYSEDELLRKTFQEITHPDDLENDLEHKRKIIRDDISDYCIEKRYLHRDGYVIWGLLIVAIVRDGRGYPLYYVAQMEDITERKLLEEKMRVMSDALVRKTAFLEAVVHSSCDGMFVDDDERRRLLQNQRYIELRKLPPEIASGGDHEKRVRYCMATDRNPEQFREKLDYLHCHPLETSLDEIELTDGTILERYSAPVQKDGKHYGRIWTFHDVTDRKRRENELRWETTFLRTLLNSSREAILVLDRRRRQVIVNRNMIDLWKIPEGSFDDESIILHLMRAIKDPRAFFETIDRVHSHPDETVHIGLELNDGAFIDAYSSPVVGTDNEHYGRIWTFRDVTEWRHHRNLLENLSFSDGLTGLANRRRFDDFLQHEWNGCTRDQKPLSLILMDIDFFKEYNDNYGHLAGDDCLRKISNVLASVVKRSVDLAARYGGEEFACILPNTDADGAETLAYGIREAINRLSIPHRFSSVADHVTLSLGVATLIPQKEQRLSDLLQLADNLLYSAKQNGRNGVHTSRRQFFPAFLKQHNGR